MFIKNLYKVQGDNINTINTEIASSDDLNITGSLYLTGSIFPEGIGSHDLGSAANPWRDLHIMSSSIHFYDADGEIGRITYEKDVGLKITDEADDFDGITTTINGGSF